ncbi:MAG: response regulator [Planctomycetota bacterium]
MSTRKILIAEDDAQFRKEVGDFIRRNGFAVVCVEDGYQAVDFALREMPDLLVLDIHMPAGDGFSVHQRLQRHPDLAVTPVIYMTHDPSTNIEEFARRDGAYTLLHKPFDLNDLLASIRKALGETTADAA